MKKSWREENLSETVNDNGDDDVGELEYGQTMCSDYLLLHNKPPQTYGIKQ